MNSGTVALEDVETLAMQLSPLQKVCLVERIMATVEEDLTALDELDRDSQLFAQAKAQATGFITLDEMLQDYERATGQHLDV